MTTQHTRRSTAPAVGAGAPLADRLIRDLVAAHPETLGVLAPLGIDLCCGGGHPLGGALDLHGLDRDAILPRVARVVAGSTPETE